MNDKTNAAVNNVQIKNEPSSDEYLPVSNNKNTDEDMGMTNILKRKNIPHFKTRKKRRKRIVVQEFSSSSDEDEYSLTISNLPNDWNYLQIKNYIDRECGPVDEIEMLKQGDYVNCAIRLAFQNSDKCEEIMKKLQDKEVEGRKLQLQMNGTLRDEKPEIPADEVKSCSETNEIPPTVTTPIADEDTWSGDPKELFGLKPQFLKSLGITPPLQKWVHVTNFRCEKSELRDVMELAGRVLMCSVFAVTRKQAIVMYSHPLEAVQAISMLDGQQFYGQALKVYMNINPSDMLVLPKGLFNIGPGLGINGKPIRDITKQYKQYLKKQSSSVNPILFNEVDAELEFLNKREMVELGDKINAEINNLKESFKNNKRFVQNVVDLERQGTKDDKNRNLDTKSKPSSSVSNSPELTLSPNPSIRMIGPPNAPRFIGPQDFNSPRSTPPDRLSHNPAPNIPQPFRPTPPVPQNVPPSGPSFMPAPNIPQPFRATPPIPQNVPPSGPSFMPAPNIPQPFRATPPIPQNIPPSGPSFRPALFNPPPAGQFGSPQGPFGNMAGPNFAPQPMPGPFGAGPMIPQAPMNSVVPRPTMRPHVPVPGPVRLQGNVATVHFANLPPTTTFPLLCEKLSLCGQVMSVQVTTPGCAVATFAHNSHAERCFQTYNGMNVEGYIMNVKIM